MPSFNTLIGLPFLFTLPAFLVWTTLSFHVWSVAGRHLQRSNYRLSVSCFLATTTMLVADLARLRFHIAIGSFTPDATTWVVFVVRWAWGASVLWCTIVLYGSYVPRLFGKVWGQRAGPGDPYTDDPAPQVDRVASLSWRLRQVARDLNDIIERIDDDEPLVLPGEGSQRNRPL